MWRTSVALARERDAVVQAGKSAREVTRLPIGQKCPTLQNGKSSVRGLRQWVIRRFDQGVSPVHPHTLRHSCGFSLAHRGYDLQLINITLAIVIPTLDR